MFSYVIKTTIVAFALLINSAAFAGPVLTADQWWLQTDNLGGIRQSTTAPDYFFAVSQNTIWDPTATYLAPEGYRVATTAEGNSVFNQPNFSGQLTYFMQGGWNGYSWEGQSRYYFRFADSNTTSAYKHAGNYDEYYVQNSTAVTQFAGMVLILDPTNVSAVSTPLNIGALGLLGALFLRRKNLRK
jgi:hypothetical protein